MQQLDSVQSVLIGLEAQLLQSQSNRTRLKTYMDKKKSEVSEKFSALDADYIKQITRYASPSNL